ncbi:MAG TPA: hypothetical protein VFH70_07815 [Acidimicrobiales bacterium]|nr:hypothetical protein [Acidimicrobiales bacterium]
MRIRRALAVVAVGTALGVPTFIMTNGAKATASVNCPSGTQAKISQLQAQEATLQSQIALLQAAQAKVPKNSPLYNADQLAITQLQNQVATLQASVVGLSALCGTPVP